MRKNKINSLTLSAPIPQNGQTHSNNCLSVSDNIVRLALEGLKFRKSLHLHLQGINNKNLQKQKHNKP